MDTMKGMRAFALLLAMLPGLAATAQDDKLGTETVTVVRSYTPTVSDAYKIKSLPELNDSIALQKKPVKYSINSVPVASTFTPSKGKAAAVERAAPEVLYNSYASMALGNYNNALAELYISRDFDRGSKRLDVGLDHRSSRGQLDGTPLDTDFYNTGLDVTWSQRERDWNWSAGAGLEHRLYNWYGLPQGVYSEAALAGADPTQNYMRGQFEGKVHLEDTYFTDANVLARRFWDAADSWENRLKLEPKFEFPVTEETFNLGLLFDYVGGHFANADQAEYTNSGPFDYSFLQAGANPSLMLLRDDLKLELGARFVYGMDLEQNDGNFYIYPAVKASYNLLDETVIAFGGVEGGLQQNSYYDYSVENPFVAPTLAVRPTDRQYDAYLGLKGQLTSDLSYTVKGSYKAENFRPLFILNPQNEARGDEKAYIYGNSFRVFYDDLRTLSIFGELQLSLNRNFSMGVSGSVYDYSTETDNPAWNLPDMEARLFLDYQIGSGWYLGANLFYVGQRDDFSSVALANTDPGLYPATLLSLDGFFDANMQVGYHVNPQLSLFAKASNLANNSYQRWAQFPVQGFQVLGGVSYKFDL